MQQPERAPGLRARLITVAGAFMAVLAASPSAEDIPDALGDDWYRTELLIFVREDMDSRTAQQFDPLPSLAYPSAHRYLIDPALAEQRLAESQAFVSRVDSDGRQYLTVPSPVDRILDHNRPDVLVEPMDDPRLQTGTETGAGALEPPAPTPDDPNLPELLPDDANDPAPDPNAPLLALPYEVLETARLDFAEQTRSLRRRGHRVLFHASWWAQLEENVDELPIVLDRSGDPDSFDWPALQGSVRVYRSRYLHTEVDLWVNTMGDYLPAGWQIPSPPLADVSLLSTTLAGRALNPWRPAPIPELLPLPGDMLLPDDPNQLLDPNAVTVETELARDYPWRHAITHRQSRRMRSSEIHYLDHPVIGVIVRITPVGEENLPLRDPSHAAFRERHGLPVLRLLPEPPVSEAP